MFIQERSVGSGNYLCHWCTTSPQHAILSHCWEARVPASHLLLDDCKVLIRRKSSLHRATWVWCQPRPRYHRVGAGISAGLCVVGSPSHVPRIPIISGWSELVGTHPQAPIYSQSFQSASASAYTPHEGKQGKKSIHLKYFFVSTFVPHHTNKTLIELIKKQNKTTGKTPKLNSLLPRGKFGAIHLFWWRSDRAPSCPTGLAG